MKKILSVLLIALMLTSMLTLTVSAKDPYGTIIEVQYTTTAPTMDDGVIDETWGKPLIHVDKNSKNAGITDYSYYHDHSEIKADQNINMDMYAKWTDDTLYICFVSPDAFLKGDGVPHRGDGFQLDMTYGIIDICHNLDILCPECSTDAFADRYSYGISFFQDDYSIDFYGAANYCDTSLYWDEKDLVKIGKYAIPFSQLGVSKKSPAKDGDIISFAMLCVNAEKGDGTGYTGWLEWGNFFDDTRCFEEAGAAVCTKESLNKNTTTANSIKLVGKSGGSTQPATPVEDPTPLKGAPSTWAEEEVKKAIAAGLVPEELQKDYTKGISRANLSKCLSALLDKVYGKAPTKTDAKFNDTTDADVLKAANLGIINGYDAAGGTKDFKPSNTLKRSEMTAIINRVAKLCGKTVEGFDSEVKFADTASHWCNKELGWAVHQGIVKGTSATTFSPENTLTVEQTIMMIYRTYTALK